ncbi:MAG: hypothetical protein WBD20_18465 [Pirellulaceae bacterium]
MTIVSAQDDEKAKSEFKPPQIPTDPIELSDLPKPPDEIAKLIDSGKVKLCTGRISWSEMRQARDRTGVAGSGYRLAAETKAEFNYDYLSRVRWRQRVEGGKKILLVTVRFSTADLQVKHTIWFRSPPTADQFWDDAIVQHEFDHVRLSTHPMIEKQFAKKIRAASSFRHELADGETIGETLVNSLVRERIKEAIDEISEFVEVRYKELDRVTRHGLDGVPGDSDVIDWLKHES